MKHSGSRLSIGKKMYLFVLGTVIFAVTGIWIISYRISRSQIDNYYKTLTINSARTFASFVDTDYLRDLRDAAASEEFQAIRDLAEQTDDESLIENYLIEHNLWIQYQDQRDMMRRFVNNNDDLKYLYILSWDPEASEDGLFYDMYILDADEVPLYQTGYYEEREPEFEGFDPRKETDAVISNGDWGWLCSGFAPVYDRYGNLVCTVGCDVDMETVMAGRKSNVVYLLISAAILSSVILFLAFILVRKYVVRPLNDISDAIKKFSPKKDGSYEDSGVINIDFDKNTEDEIDDIYNDIRSMQIRIIDYINDISEIREEKEKAENEVTQISLVAYKDALTGIGNKQAYYMKEEELNSLIADGQAEFAIVMMDINFLKNVNDNHGHDAGDKYLTGCCHIICDTLKHSPVFRIGGDEFVAVLTGEDYKNRSARTEELRERFDKAFADKNAEPWERYSASVGISDYKSDDASVDDVFKRADAMMYESKNEFKKTHQID